MPANPNSRNIAHAMSGPTDPIDADNNREVHGLTNHTDFRPSTGPKPLDPAADHARCFVRLANDRH
jgi:hypothetical protein